MKLTLAIACMAVLASSSMAETFRLKDTATDKIHGPFHFGHGAPIKVGSAEWELIRLDPKHNEILAATEKAMISDLDFRNAAISDFILFLNDFCRRTGMKDLDLVLSHTVDPTTPITMTIRDMSVHEMLCRVAEMSGNRWTIRHGSIMLDAADTFAKPARLPPSAILDGSGLFSLKAKGTGKTYGPFQLKNKTYIQMEEAILVVVLDPSAASTLAPLKELMIPSLDFRDANPKDVVLFLNETIKRIRPSSEAAIQLAVDDGAAKAEFNVTFSFRNKSLYDTLGIICDASGLQWDIRDGKIVLEPAKP